MIDKKESSIWTIVGIVVFVLVIYLLSRHAFFITNTLHRTGVFTPIVAMILYAVLALTPMTTDPITITLGVIYGPLMGAILGSIGNTICALVEYSLGLRLKKSEKFKGTKFKMPFGLGKVQPDSAAFLVLGKMIPLYGSKVVSIIAGMNKVEIKRYVLLTLVTVIAGSFLLSFGGFGLVHLIRFTRILKTLGL